MLLLSGFGGDEPRRPAIRSKGGCSIFEELKGDDVELVTYSRHPPMDVDGGGTEIPHNENVSGIGRNRNRELFV